jgi:actin-related protein 6
MALILDNGAGNLKAGLYSYHHLNGNGNVNSLDPLWVLPNLTAKVQKSMQYLIADQVQDFLNASLLQFVRPFDRGYLNNWQCEIEVWTYLFHEKMKLSPSETSLVLTEPLLNLESIQNDTNEVVFEYFGFKDYMRRPAASFSAYLAGWDGCTVVDSGFSFSHVVPFVQGRCQRNAVSNNQ